MAVTPSNICYSSICFCFLRKSLCRGAMNLSFKAITRNLTKIMIVFIPFCCSSLKYILSPGKLSWLMVKSIWVSIWSISAYWTSCVRKVKMTCFDLEQLNTKKRRTLVRLQY